MQPVTPGLLVWMAVWLLAAAPPAHAQRAIADTIADLPPGDTGLARPVIPSGRLLATSYRLPFETAGAVSAGLPERADLPGPYGTTTGVLRDVERRSTERAPWWVPLASAAVPGAGQARLRQERFVAYLALEGFLWARYAADRREALRERAAYRRVAMRVSRAPFPGDKPDGNFEYYERMEHWIASGAYDVDPANPALDPETDTTTFNGAMWLLARRTYWPTPYTPPPPGSPAAIAAMRFYEESAIPPNFQWSWRNARYEQDVFRRHIRASNEAFRNAIEDIGVVIANHVLSTVDAYVSMRLQLRASQQATGDPDLGLIITVPWTPFGGPSSGTATVPRRR